MSARGRIRLKLFNAQRGLCHYCSRQMVMRQFDELTCTIDHKIPESEGGSRERHNIVGACWQCNTARGNMRYEDFKANWQRVHAAGLPRPGSKYPPLNHANPYHNLTVERSTRPVTKLPASVVYQYAKKP